MKTLFEKILEENSGLQAKLYKSYDISPHTINKAIKQDKTLLWSSKCKIYNALVKEKLIDEEKISLPELFGETGEK